LIGQIAEVRIDAVHANSLKGALAHPAAHKKVLVH
jgi:hypothetical protein